MTESKNPVIQATSNYMPVLITREKFSELSGLPIGVVIGMCNKNWLPCMTLGKRSLVNLALLNKRALEKEFT